MDFDKICASIPKFHNIQRRGSIADSQKNALEMFELIKQVAEDLDWRYASELMNKIKESSKDLLAKDPNNLVYRNVLLRMLKTFREDISWALKGEAQLEENRTNLLFAKGDEIDYKKVERDSRLNFVITESLDVAYNDLSTCREVIAEKARQYIQENDVVYTMGGNSDTVYKFLRAAAKSGRIRFKVVVAEAAPSYSGRTLAARLAELERISVLVVPDSHAAALMPLVKKVILSCHQMCADGSMRCRPGSFGVLACAEENSVPALVLLPTYKMNPPSAAAILASSEAESTASMTSTPTATEGINQWDDIPPAMATLFITNVGDFDPSCVYSIASELFHRNDVID